MSKKMRAVFTVADYSNTDKIADILHDEHVPFHISLHGQGAADSAILEYLGFGENKKNITISVLTLDHTRRLFSALRERLSMDKPGRGIVFSVPVSSMTAFLAELTEKSSVGIESAEKEENNMSAEFEHELIVTIVTKGCFDDVKNAANAAGARGGTLLHALGLGSEEAQKFLGISIQPEKDIILNVVRREDKNTVMKAIAEAAGINTEGKGIIFSLPVDGSIGLQGAAPKE